MQGRVRSAAARFKFKLSRYRDLAREKCHTGSDIAMY